MLQDSYEIMDSQDEVRKLQHLVKTLEIQNEHLRVGKQRNRDFDMNHSAALSCSWGFEAEETFERLDLQWEPSLNDLDQLDITGSNTEQRKGLQDRDHDSTFWDELEVLDLQPLDFLDDESWLCDSAGEGYNIRDKDNKTALDWLYQDELPVKALNLSYTQPSLEQGVMQPNQNPPESPKSVYQLRSQLAGFSPASPVPNQTLILAPSPITSRLDYMARRFTPSPDRIQISTEKEFAIPAPVAPNTSSTPRNIDTRTFTRPKKKFPQFSAMPSPFRPADSRNSPYQPSSQLEAEEVLDATFSVKETANASPRNGYGALALNSTYMAEPEQTDAGDPLNPLLNATFEVETERETNTAMATECESDVEEDMRDQTRLLHVTLNQTFTPQKGTRMSLPSPARSRNQPTMNLNATYTAEDEEDEGNAKEIPGQMHESIREEKPKSASKLVFESSNSRHGSNNSLLHSHHQDVQDVLLAASRQEESLEHVSSTPLRLGGLPAAALRGADSVQSLGSPICASPSIKSNGCRSEGSLADLPMRTQARIEASPSPTPSSAASSPHSSQSLEANSVSAIEKDLVRRSMPNLALRKISGISRLPPPIVSVRFSGLNRMSLHGSESRLRPPIAIPPIRMPVALNTTRPGALAPNDVFKQPQVPVKGISRLQAPSKVRPANAQVAIPAQIGSRVLNRATSQAPPHVNQPPLAPMLRPVAPLASGLRPPSVGIPRPVSRIPGPRYR